MHSRMIQNMRQLVGHVHVIEVSGNVQSKAECLQVVLLLSLDWSNETLQCAMGRTAIECFRMYVGTDHYATNCLSNPFIFGRTNPINYM